jgi:hypothetical protein
MYTSQRPSIFMRDEPILSSERILHKNCCHRGLVVKKKKSLIMSLNRLGAKTN